MQYRRLTIKILAAAVMSSLAACAAQRTVIARGGPLPPLPPYSLAIAWKTLESKLYIEKQERGNGLQKPVITLDDRAAVGQTGRNSVAAIQETLLPQLKSRLKPYLARKSNPLEEKFNIKIELVRVVMDTDGSREAFVSAEITPAYSSQVVWYRQIAVYASKSTPDTTLVQNCTDGIMDALRKSDLIEWSN